MSAPVKSPRVTQHARHSTVALAVALGCLCYVLAHLFGAPKPHYLPIEGVWSTQPPAGSISMGYYGLLLYAFGGAASGVAIGRLPGIRERLRTASLSAGLARITSAIVFASLAYFIIKELGHWS